MADYFGTDPDSFALLLVQQWCSERGFGAALAALQRESGSIYVPEKLPLGSMLMQLVYDHMERQLAQEPSEASAAQRQMEERLLQGGEGDYPPPPPAATLTGLHAGNIICLACWPGQQRAVSGAGDGSLCAFGYDGNVLATAQLASGVLCVDVQQAAGSQAPLIAAGCMDGSLSVVDAAGGEVLCSARPHTKYTVAARWAADGCHLISGSWDHSFIVHRLQRSAPADGRGGSGSSSSGWELVLVHREQCTARVQAVELLPDGRSFLVAQQGSNYLRQFEIAAGGSDGSAASAGATATSSESGSSWVRQTSRLNLNANGDDHVSFSAAHLVLSPTGDFLLVSADTGRLLLFELEGWTQLRQFHGLPIEQFHSFSAAWHRSERYVMAAGALGAVVVFDVPSAKVAAQFRAHDKNVRGLAYDPDQNALLTCSFDRTVRLWRQPQQQQQLQQQYL